MTKEEAKQAIASGKKVTHALFDPLEYVRKSTQEDGVVVFEDGVKQVEREFWALRLNPIWNNDWSLYK